jgi:plastocyanin
MVNPHQLRQYRDVTRSKGRTGKDPVACQQRFPEHDPKHPRRTRMKTLAISLLATLFVVALTLGFSPGLATHAVAQSQLAHAKAAAPTQAGENPAQVVALDECDPSTFNAALGPDFCHNVTVGAFTTLSDLFAKAAAGTPDPGWDFEPDTLNIKKGTPLIAVDQGGEPHTFTEVAQFGGGFIPGLNAGQDTVPECVGGFANVAVARTRILQGSQLQVTGLSKGKHFFQCCIHPWMRVEVDVK